MRILCLGGSYTGRYLASNFAGEAAVTFLTRNPERLRAEGFSAVTAGELPSACDIPTSLILDTVPTLRPDGELRLPYRSALSALMEGASRPVYLHLSTTAVYPSGLTAQRDEDLPTHNEDSTPHPESGRAKDRLLLEEAIVDTYSGARILRCGGIYGPGRSLATRFSKGDFSRTATGNRMVTRIHVHDLCRLILSFGRVQTGTRANLVNAVDRRPSCNRETFEYLERLLGITVPGNWRNEAPKGRMVVSKHADGLLGGHYRFPTYREGFAACLAPAGHQSMIGPTNEEPTWK